MSSTVALLVSPSTSTATTRQPREARRRASCLRSSPYRHHFVPHCEEKPTFVESSHHFVPHPNENRQLFKVFLTMKISGYLPIPWPAPVTRTMSPATSLIFSDIDIPLLWYYVILILHLPDIFQYWYYTSLIFLNIDITPLWYFLIFILHLSDIF